METILALIIGAAIPLIIQSLQSKEKKKFFELEHKEKLKLTSLDKRLEAHQKAYAQCSRFWEVIDSANEEEISNVIKEGKELMINYSLYLENGTRKKMIEVLGFFHAYCPRKKFISEFEPVERKRAIEIFIKESKKLEELSKLIQEEVALEPISLNESIKPIRDLI